MTYRIILSKRFQKFLNKHDNKFSQTFFSKAQILAANPFSSATDTKKIAWYNNRYRLRIGKYRMLYDVRDDGMIIFFLDGDTRWDIYKK